MVLAVRAIVMRAFDGLRVVEAANFVSGPVAGKLLAELGAEVIKIEQPGDGDPMRLWGDEHYSPWFIAHNPGKRSMTLRLGTEGASEVIRRLMPTVDVLIENFRPGVADRLGLGYERLREYAPRLVYCSISGAGPTGPYATLPFYDTLAQSVSGLLCQLMNPSDPKPLGPALADTLTGVLAAYGILAAIIERAQTGKGQRLDASLVASCLALLGEPLSVLMNTGELPQAETRRQAAQAHVFACKDRRLLSVHLSGQNKNWEAIARATGREDLLREPRFGSRPDRIRRYAELHAELGAEFLKKAREVWLRLLIEAEVPCAPVNDLGEAIVDPQIRHLDAVRTETHPDVGRVHWIGNPIKFLTSPLKALGAPPLLGEHTTAILEELGYALGEMEYLRTAGVI